MQSKNQVRSDFHFNDSASVPSPYLSYCGDFASRRNTACFLLLIHFKTAVAELRQIFDLVEAELVPQHEIFDLVEAELVPQTESASFRCL